MTAFAREELIRTLANGARDLHLGLDDVQLGKLMDYLALLSKWNAVYNLTALRDPKQMVTHHLLDSLAVVPAFAGAKNILDVGAGGGLPGIVLAIARPDMRVSLVDTVHKKTAFLTQVKAELGLANVTVHTSRVEQLKVPHKFDVITSRAFAELNDFVTWSGHLLEEGGHFIALKGVMPDQEIARLPAGWKVGRVESLTVPGLDAERHLVFIEAEAQA
ncbi:16S rRNA (guanine(527)-N(7))-methyltransferase RsmG [Noviherbaspirillum denitrificans]|uniref:Ribosomal RNA small subunit methyltransferase G n=1 Tax=Noviherbaspirillum denitrificans TaxID=1968433 RepID=A0A254T6A1_9BURK|nr:16S rRNA (guanine(527)-N(7))-methyltransferase RsmG [Noviherbaspirillum denitrificans]OWW18209.1 16S rRNA (guanine(527)-N(7))-methyltransferase RsmG [Noviherbaspirillum denitrificans]